MPRLGAVGPGTTLGARLDHVHFTSQAPKPRYLSRRYPAWGLVLAAFAPLGLLVVRSLVVGEFPDPAWILGEIATHIEIYAYLGLSTAVVFVLLGFVLGRKEDRLERRFRPRTA